MSPYKVEYIKNAGKEMGRIFFELCKSHILCTYSVKLEIFPVIKLVKKNDLYFVLHLLIICYICKLSIFGIKQDKPFFFFLRKM